jgi:hypothetical protein
MPTETTSPYSRENFWGDLDGDEPHEAGHAELAGVDGAEYVAFQYLHLVTDPICKRALEQWDREVALTDPCLRMPKQVDHGTHVEEFGVFAFSYRYNPETGWLNWDGATGVAVPEPDEREYYSAAEWYLSANEACIDDASFEQWLAYAKQLYHDPQFNGKEAFIQFVRHKRAYDDPQNRDVTAIPDA